MTVNDFLRRLNKDDYDKCIIWGDSEIGWTNISGKIKITDSTISLYENPNRIFSDE